MHRHRNKYNYTYAVTQNFLRDKKNAKNVYENVDLIYTYKYTPINTHVETDVDE